MSITTIWGRCSATRCGNSIADATEQLTTAQIVLEAPVGPAGTLRRQTEAVFAAQFADQPLSEADAVGMEATSQGDPLADQVRQAPLTAGVVAVGAVPIGDQPAEKGGLTAPMVARLKLKWAFGFGGANATLLVSAA